MNIVSIILTIILTCSGLLGSCSPKGKYAFESLPGGVPQSFTRKTKNLTLKIDGFTSTDDDNVSPKTPSHQKQIKDLSKKVEILEVKVNLIEQRDTSIRKRIEDLENKIEEFDHLTCCNISCCHS